MCTDCEGYGLQKHGLKRYDRGPNKDARQFRYRSLISELIL